MVRGSSVCGGVWEEGSVTVVCVVWVPVVCVVWVPVACLLGMVGAVALATATRLIPVPHHTEHHAVGLPGYVKALPCRHGVSVVLTDVH